MKTMQATLDIGDRQGMWRRMASDVRSTAGRGAVAAALVAAVAIVAGCTSAGSYGTANSTAVPSEAPSAAPVAAAASPQESAAGGAGAYGGRYSSGSGDAYGAGGASPAASAASAGGVEVTLTSAASGAHLSGAGGMTLYVFKKDGPSTSACSGACATNWPPLSVGAGGAITKGAGVPGAVATFTRSDGTLQATYKGAPLYYFAGDAAAGDTNGQGINGVWFAATP